jgi:lysophospholipid acyltransferase
MADFGPIDPLSWWLDAEAMLARRIGILPVMVRYLACLGLVYPLAALHRAMPSTLTRHLLALGAGLFLAFANFGLDTLHFVVSAGVPYVLCALAPRQRLMPVAVFVFSIVYIGLGHIQRMYFYVGPDGANPLGGPVVHWTSPQMLLIIKITAFAWSVHDGHRPPHELLASQEQRAIRKLPSLLEYYSYIFFFAGFLTGPIPEYREYAAFTDRSLFAQEKGGRIPEGSWRAGLTRFVMALAAVPLFYLHKKLPETFVLSPAFLEQSIWYRWLYVIASCELGFDKYYVVFFLGEGALMMSGMGYNGRDTNGRVLWDRLLMLRLLPFKLAQNPSTLAANWNIVSANWLKRYVYIRLLPARSTPDASLPPKAVSFMRQILPFFATFFVSAVWHGFYAGYYLFFLSLAGFGAIGRLNRIYIRPYFMAADGRTGDYPKKYLYDAASLFCMVVGLNYHIVIFRTFTFDNAMQAWAAFNFLPHWLGLAAILFYAVALPTGLLRRPKKKIPDAAAAAQHVPVPKKVE